MRRELNVGPVNSKPDTRGATESCSNKLTLSAEKDSCAADNSLNHLKKLSLKQRVYLLRFALALALIKPINIKSKLLFSVPMQTVISVLNLFPVGV